MNRPAAAALTCFHKTPPCRDHLHNKRLSKALLRKEPSSCETFLDKIDHSSPNDSLYIVVFSFIRITSSFKEEKRPTVVQLLAPEGHTNFFTYRLVTSAQMVTCKTLSNRMRTEKGKRDPSLNEFSESLHRFGILIRALRRHSISINTWSLLSAL